MLSSASAYGTGFRRRPTSRLELRLLDAIRDESDLALPIGRRPAKPWDFDDFELPKLLAHQRHADEIVSILGQTKGHCYLKSIKAGDLSHRLAPHHVRKLARWVVNGFSRQSVREMGLGQAA
jgi:hypothetical protein